MPPYGRLDVFWPDGKFQTFPLSEPTTSVGRSSGSTICLDTENLSRYHCSLTYVDGQAYITDMDSANGTFVDGMRLPPNTRQPLYGGEEIQIGELRLIYHTLDESPTRPMAVPEETTRRIELEAPAFRLDLIGPSQPVSPGAHIAAELTITNTGTETERYLIEVNGLPRDWVRIDRPLVEIAPGKSEPVVINFKPARRSDSAPGDYHAYVSVHPHRESLSLLNADFVLSVLPFSGFGMALEASELDDGQRFRLHLHNQGSEQLPLTITVRDAGNLLAASLPRPQLTLAPGQRLLVQGGVTPRRRPLLGEAQVVPFDVVVQSRDAAAFMAAQRAYATVRPALPAWMPLALVGAAAALIVLLVVALALVGAPGPTEPPQIETFNVSSTLVAQGEPLVVNWGVTGATRVVLTLNGTPVFREEGNPSTTSYTINTTDLDGSVAVGVLASNDAGNEGASHSVTVVRPMRIDLFTVNPPQLVRNVVQSLTVAWSVPGATLTRVNGLGSYTTARVEPVYGPEATLVDIVGIPQSPLSLTLYAEDASGNSLEQTVVVEVVDPLCEPASGEGVTLRSEPRPDGQVIGTIPEDSLVVVDAQDETRQWLRVLLTGDLRGWGPIAAFRCADNFDVGSLRQVLVIPTVAPASETPVAPTATEAPRVTATPRPTTTRTPTRTPPATAAPPVSGP